MPGEKPKNKLTDLEIKEVSLVNRGAIGEKFTVIKSENEDIAKSVSNQLTGLSDQEFANVMRQMMQRYNEINKNPVNKGGTSDMDEIKKMLEGFMDTVNKNFIEVNKAVTDLKGKVDAKTEEDEKSKAAEEAVKKSADTQKTVEELGKAMGDLTKTVGEVAKAVEGLATVKDAVDKVAGLKLEETIADFKKRMEDIEKAENPSNQPKDSVQKSDGDTPKTPFWKSILGAGNEQ